MNSLITEDPRPPINYILLVIRNRWEISFALISVVDTISIQIVTQHSCLDMCSNYMSIDLSGLGLEQNNISI